MKKKEYPKAEFKCSTCGYVPEPDKSKSNENWNVYQTTCPKCGGRIQMNFKYPD